MPRVYHVKSARKDNPVAKIGEDYYWWQFAFGSKQFSKTPPKRSQLTQSGFLSNLYDLQDGLQNRFTDIDSIEDDLQDFISELESMRDECQDSLDNMPEHLQEASTSGELLTERIDLLEQWISDLEAIDADIDADLSEDKKQIDFEAIIQEVCDTDQHF